MREVVREPEARERLALVLAARAGDRESLGRLLRQCGPLVEWALVRMVGPTPDLPDLVQDVFVEAVRSIGSYRAEARFETWLRSLAVHTACRYLRAPRRRHPTLSLVEAEHRPELARSEDFDAGRVFRRVHELLDRIGPKKRVSFLLHVALGYSTKEVAALMGSTHSAAKARIWFARRELDALAREDPLLAQYLKKEGM